jgi:amino acid adenylation domain-containing protein
MTLLAAFQVLLARYTGQEDIVVGSPIAGRTRTELEDLIGFFVNTLLLRTDLAGDPTFRELLGRVREVTLDAHAHQDVPFERLVEELQPQRDLSRNPLFQVMFVLQNAPRRTEECAGLTLEEVRGVDTGTAKLDLTLYLEETEQGLAGECEYSMDLFDAGTIARLIEHFQTLLAGIVADPDQHLSQLPLLSEAERQQLLVAWNETQADYPAEACLHELFEAQVERTPEAVAVVCEEQQLTYQELNQRANQLAHHLRTRGVGPEVCVGLCLERALELVVGLLGILKAGGAYVPLDPTYPPERLAFMLQDAQAPVLVTQEHLVAALPTAGAHVVCLDSGGQALAQQSTANPLSGATAASLAYVLYTSGSTGQPKGVLATHRSAVNRLHWMWQVYPFAPAERCCQKTSLSFVDSVWEIFGPLLRGIGTVIIPEAVLQDPPLLMHTLAEHGVTRIVLVPSLLRVLLDTDPDLQARLPALTFWVSSGEALPLELAQRFRERLPQSRLLNLYGSSEVAADVTCYDTTEGAPRPCVPIGRPIANTQVYILDRHRLPVPLGVPGELCSCPGVLG